MQQNAPVCNSRRGAGKRGAVLLQSRGGFIWCWVRAVVRGAQPAQKRDGGCKCFRAGFRLPGHGDKKMDASGDNLPLDGEAALGAYGGEVFTLIGEDIPLGGYQECRRQMFRRHACR